MVSWGTGTQQKIVLWSCTIHPVDGALVGAGSLYSIFSQTNPGNFKYLN
jgi:hypothetical protein